MPLYIYKHPKKEQYIEVVQRMTDKHEYVDEDGVKWERVFTNPNWATDTVNISPNSEKDFLRRTHKKMTMGDMWDASAELSEQRKQRYGYDRVKDKAIERYKKKCHGKRHPLAESE